MFNTNKPRSSAGGDTIDDEFRMEAIQNAIYEIFKTDDVDMDMIHEKGLPKSCPPSSLLSRFCRQALQLDDWEEVRHLWKLFVQVLFKFWDEANSDSGNHDIDVISERRWYIPHTDSEIEWTSCLLEQKINMLNLCCLAQIDSKSQKMKESNKKTVNAWESMDSVRHFNFLFLIC